MLVLVASITAYCLFLPSTPILRLFMLSLLDALPIWGGEDSMLIVDAQVHIWGADSPDRPWPPGRSGERSEEHTSELQSHSDLVCRLLLEKTKMTETEGDVLHRTDVLLQLLRADGDYL